MSSYAVSLFLSGIFGVMLGVFVFINGKHKSAKIALMIFSFAVAVWCVGQALGSIYSDKNIVFLWTRVNLAGAIFIPVLYLWFISFFVGNFESRKKLIYIFFAIAFTLFILDFTPFFIADIGPRLNYPFYPYPGFAYYFFPVYFFFAVGFGLHFLFEHLKIAGGEKLNQSKYILWASILGFGGGLTAFFPVFNIPFPSLAHYFMPLYMGITVYAIVKHQLLDIRVLVKTSITYTVLTLFFAGCYSLFLIVFSNLFQDFVGWKSIYSTILFVFCFVVVFEPIYKRVQKSVDKLFFKGDLKYVEILKSLSDNVVSIFDKDELFMKVKETLKKTMNLSSVEISLNDEPMPGFELNIPIRAKSKIIGFLNLGGKLSHDMFSKEEIGVLLTLSNQMAIAIDNANLYQQILRGDKLASLGNIAASMAHEIKNPLASIKGLTQILDENIKDPEFVSKYMGIVLRQIDRIDSLVEKLLQIGKPQKVVMTYVNLKDIILGIIKLIESQCDNNNIKIELCLFDIHIWGNFEQLTQAFMNVVLNSIDAMPKGGKLAIKFEIVNDKVLVVISDTGDGISPSNLKMLFDPFFTTKENGTGLGLAIFYRIITEHRGIIDIESKISHGTTFKTWFYVKQKQ